METLAGEISNSSSSRPEPKRSDRQRVRRPIRQLILRELSFSGRTMTVTQIAKAIEYHSGRTETALGRLEAAGQVVRSGERRWAI
jgi:DNA-binding MarR family transcriptional regulator